MDITCKICGATVSKRQSLAFEDGRVCRTHTEEIEKAKKEKEERLDKIKMKIIDTALLVMYVNDDTIGPNPNRWQIKMLNDEILKEKSKLDKNQEITESILYGTPEHIRITNKLRIEVSRNILGDREELATLYNRDDLKTMIKQSGYDAIVNQLSYLWYDIDVSEKQNAFTAKEFLDAIIVDAQLSLKVDSPEYNSLLENVTKKGPVNRQLAAAGTILAIMDLMNRHKNKTA